MSELAFAPLAEFADVTMGQSPGAGLCNTEGKGLPFLQGCAEFGTRNPQTTIFCSPPLRIAKAESALISVRAPVGTMNYADQDYCIGRGLGSFKAKPGLSNTVFLKHAVELNVGYLHRRSQGSTFSAVSSGDVKTVPIPAFAFAKQKKIAAIFTAIDTAIEKTEALIAKYQQIKTGLMHDLFTRGVLPNGQLRPTREQAPELYQETVTGWIPREWALDVLDQAIRIIDCKHVTPHYVSDGYPVIRPRNVKLEGLDFRDVEYVSRRDYLALTDIHEPREGDIIFSRNASFGIPSYVDASVGKFVIGQDVVVMTKSQADTKFVFYALSSDHVFKQISVKSGGSTFARINLGRRMSA